MRERPPAFVADAMLGSLARKLRVFGYDTVYFRDGPDSELERLASDEGRILLTSDRRLFAHAASKGLLAFLVQGSSERSRLESVVEGAKRASIRLDHGPTRCAYCNGELALVRKAGVAGRIPKAVLAKHRVFYRCAGCDKFYWKGRQWSRLRRLSSVLLA